MQNSAQMALRTRGNKKRIRQILPHTALRQYGKTQGYGSSRQRQDFEVYTTKPFLPDRIRNGVTEKRKT
jgi:hypothetical protein